MKCRECEADGEYGCRAGFTSIIIDGDWGCRDADRLLDAYHFNQVKGDSSTSTRTRADRIRAKSDEELATWVETIAGCDLCPMLDEQCSGGEVNSRASCKRHWLEWLRQEAEE